MARLSSATPAIKTSTDREALIKALNEGRLDIIATDHAPHTKSEKENTYFKAPAGLPLVQHAVQVMFRSREEERDQPGIAGGSGLSCARRGEDVPMSEHPNIRSANACLTSSSFAVELAEKHNALLHVLHLTTAIEMGLFSEAHRSEKRITGEVCAHHLWFDEASYEDLGTRIKCNPAIKTSTDREALIKALNEGRLDIIATDHAPHTKSEKENTYFKAPAGLPLVQHAVQVMFDLVKKKEISLELLVDRACHAPADIFGVRERGYVREGWFADLVIVDPRKAYRVEQSNLLYKCQWSPFEGHKFSSTIDTTIVNGVVVFRDGELSGEIAGQRLEFTRSR